MLVHLIILNYNGRRLLPECLPSILRAADASRHRCDVVIIDNSSTDESLSWLSENYPLVRVIRCPNLGLCSYNDVVPRLCGPDPSDNVAVLLNNDIKLHPGAIDPLIDPLLVSDTTCFMTAPRCRRFDDATYEGFRTAVRWRWGLVQATALYPGHEATVGMPGQTASAGAVMAVDCRKFVELGGFDPLYLPGRLEDLDFAFRAYRAGYHACYVPHALCWHKGMATFEAAFGTHACDEMALRNTLLFQWKNLRDPANIARQIFGAAVRSVADVIRAPWTPWPRRWSFVRALVSAWKRKKKMDDQGHAWHGGEPHFIAVRRERDYFRRFHPNADELNADEPLADQHQLQIIAKVDTWS
ncbi:MAG: glycosyltransferase [Planctomycetota bacterium]|nr:glycosyltransferase [Planctomycetota bacterium]